MALDGKSYEFLKKHECEFMTVDSLKSIETEELLKLKTNRTRAEYCWTCGPIIILYFIDKYHLEDVTYLDSDLMFFSSYEPIYTEIADGSVAITPQYSTQDQLSGKYCVQFMFFKNDENGIACLKWWRDECIKWCYARYEDGKFGDQKYLDSFPVLFKNVVIIKNRGAGVATWNMKKYDYKDNMVVYQGKSYPLVFYHFHGLRMTTEDNTLVFQLIDCDFSKQYDTLFFRPYMQLVADNLQKYFKIEIKAFSIKQKSLATKIFSRLKPLFRNLSVLRTIYFKFHKHNSWEKSKL